MIDLDHHQAVSRFEEIGVKDAKQLLDPYEQKGFFLELENGKIDVDTFCRKLCEHTGKQLSYDEIKYAWMGFIADVPQYKLDFLLELRKKYKVYLLSNTNPIVQSWARSEAFTPAGRPISAYFDKMYTSYEVGVTKPDAAIFDLLLSRYRLQASRTLFIDDSAVNIEAAGHLGMRTHHFTGVGRLRSELIALGLLPTPDRH